MMCRIFSAKTQGKVKAHWNSDKASKMIVLFTLPITLMLLDRGRFQGLHFTVLRAHLSQIGNQAIMDC